MSPNKRNYITFLVPETDEDNLGLTFASHFPNAKFVSKHEGPPSDQIGEDILADMGEDRPETAVERHNASDEAMTQRDRDRSLDPATLPPGVEFVQFDTTKPEESVQAVMDLLNNMFGDGVVKPKVRPDTTKPAHEAAAYTSYGAYNQAWTSLVKGLHLTPDDMRRHKGRPMHRALCNLFYNARRAVEEARIRYPLGASDVDYIVAVAILKWFDDKLTSPT